MNYRSFCEFVDSFLSVDYEELGFASFEDFLFELSVKNPRVYQCIIDFWSLKKFLDDGNKIL